MLASSWPLSSAMFFFFFFLKCGGRNSRGKDGAVASC